MHVSWQVSMMFSTVFLAYFPEIIGNSFFFLMAHEPYNNEILTFETFWPVFSKHFINTVGMMTGDSPSSYIADFAKTSEIMPFVKCLFLFRLCIVVTNTFIGITISKIDYILKKAELTRIEKRVQACQMIDVFLPNKQNDKKWTKIKFLSPSSNGLCIDTQIEDIATSSAFITAYIYDENDEKIYSFDLPCWIGFNTRNILKERKTTENEMEKAQNITIANQRNEEIERICVDMAQKLTMANKQNEEIKGFCFDMAQQQNEELKTIHDKLQENSELQMQSLQIAKEENTSLMQEIVALKESREAVLDDNALLKERLQKYESVN